ncbi:MAG: hypothetical protein IPG32_19125 [Saprospirales bacterium]|nr:hypothetical protein [Saprospirales bacterium]
MSEFTCDGSSLGDTAYLMLQTAIEPSPSIMSCGVPQNVQAGIANFGQAGITAYFGAAFLDTEGDFFAWIDTLGPATLNAGFFSLPSISPCRTPDFRPATTRSAFSTGKRVQPAGSPSRKEDTTTPSPSR